MLKIPSNYFNSSIPGNLSKSDKKGLPCGSFLKIPQIQKYPTVMCNTYNSHKQANSFTKTITNRSIISVLACSKVIAADSSSVDYPFIPFCCDLLLAVIVCL